MDTEPSIATPLAENGFTDQPSTVRYQVLGFLGAMTFVLYLDRVCIGQAAGAIQEELSLSNTGMSLVFGAFTLSYGFFEVPTGMLGDRFGSRNVLMRIVLWWSFFTALTGAALWFWMLLVVRFLFGAGEAGALPNVARVLGRWFPDSSRGTAQGIVNTCMHIGGATAPITAAVLIQSIGWRWTFLVFGCLGVLWAVFFYMWYRDNPAEHPAVNGAELTLINTGRASAQGEATGHPKIPWGLVLTSANVWLLGALMNCAAGVFYMFISWYPKYLQAGRGVSEIDSGWLASLVLAGGAVGCTLGGLLTDQIMRVTSSYRWSRTGIGVVFYSLAAVSLLVGLQCDSPTLSAVFTALACLCLHMQIPAWWATVTQISGPHVGALFGLMNSLGVVGAFASQLFLGILADVLGAFGYDGREQWDPGFYVYGAVLGIGAVLWLFVHPTKSVVESEKS